MLSKKSSTAARIKTTLFFPLTILCVLFFSKNSLSQKFEKNGNTVKYKGNTLVLSNSRIDTIIVVDPIDGNEYTQTKTFGPEPLTLNGNKIYREHNIDARPVFKSGKKGLENYIINSLSPISQYLKDGDYLLSVNNTVIDSKGDVVYYENDGLEKWDVDSTATFGGRKQTIVFDALTKSTIEIMMSNMPKFNPATNDLKPVACILANLIPQKTIIVRNHQISIEE